MQAQDIALEELIRVSIRDASRVVSNLDRFSCGLDVLL
jgi:hypothetical protein